MIGKAVKLVARAVASSSWLGQMGAVAALSTAEALLTLLNVGLVRDISTIKNALIAKVEAGGIKAQAEARIQVAKAIEAENKAVLARRAAIIRQQQEEAKKLSAAPELSEPPWPTELSNIPGESGKRRRSLRDEVLRERPQKGRGPHGKGKGMTIIEPYSRPYGLKRMRALDDVLGRKERKVVKADSASTGEAAVENAQERSRRVTEARLKLEMALQKVIDKGGYVAIDAPEFLALLRLLGVSMKRKGPQG